MHWATGSEQASAIRLRTMRQQPAPTLTHKAAALGGIATAI